MVNQHRGFTLIEVLITLAILSIGLLGMAGMQLSGLKNTTETNFRTSAAMLARDLADRMHANTIAVQNGNYDGFNSAGSNCGSAPKNCDNGVNNCSAAAMAAWDLYFTFCGNNSGSDKGYGVVNMLPGGLLKVECVDAGCAKFSPHKITVGWNERSELVGEAKQKATAVAATKASSLELLFMGR